MLYNIHAYGYVCICTLLFIFIKVQHDNAEHVGIVMRLVLRRTVIPTDSKIWNKPSYKNLSNIWSLKASAL